MGWGIIMAAVSVFGMLLLLMVSVGGDDRPPVINEQVGDAEEEFKKAA